MAKNQKHIVVIGGGTGASMVLGGLKKYPLRITAIVNIFDNGGSSGWLRKELGILPPGDLRQCARALSGSEIWQKLLEYRFEKGVLKGQCFGNLLISAIWLSARRNFAPSLDLGAPRGLSSGWMLTKILSLKGGVIPISLDNAHLYAKLKNGKILRGENKISASKIISKIGVHKLYLKPSVKAKANPAALSAIKKADIIIIAPGNLYASIIPCFLAGGILETIRKSRAKKIYVCNLENIRSHTGGWTAQDYIKEIEKYLGSGVIDAAIGNDKKLFLKKYKQNPNDKLKRTLTRHDGDKIAKAIYDLC